MARFKALVITTSNTHVTSDYILAELERVFIAKFGFTRQKAKVTSNAIAKLSEVVVPKTIKKVSRDPFDDYVLAAGLHGRVDCLVTSDNDLLVLDPYQEVRIISPDRFVSDYRTGTLRGSRINDPLRQVSAIDRKELNRG